MDISKKVEKTKEVIREAYEKFNNLAIVVSGGKDSTALLDVLMKTIKENGYEQPWVLLSDPIPFPENEEFCKKLVDHYGLKKALFYRQFSDKYREHVIKEIGGIARDKQFCCYWLKVVPLNDFLREYNIDGLFVAIRWDEHPERAKEKYFSPREDPPHTRIHPILHWSWANVWEYIKANNVPVNPLYFKGYTSLGCRPCTVPVKQDGFKDIDEIIAFAKAKKVAERAGRDIDKERIMENLRKLGYF